MNAWLYALKPASWPKLIVPAALGQALGLGQTGTLSVGGLAAGAGFTVGLLGTIVLLNDWADRDVDALKRRLFPAGCSPKTIPDGILSANAVLAGGLGFALATAAWGFGVGWAVGRPWLGVLGLGCLLVFAAYSLPPLRLNYRGGGELLEMVGVGLVLPCFNVYAQAGSLGPRVSVVLPGFVLFSLASAVASGLSDEVSDRMGGKRTFVSMLGNALGRRLVEGSMVAGLAVWMMAAVSSNAMPGWIAAGPSLVAWLNYRALRNASPRATRNEFRAQGEYKRHLHRAIWWSASVYAVLVVVAP